jgi:hypothetical protein
VPLPHLLRQALAPVLRRLSPSAPVHALPHPFQANPLATQTRRAVHAARAFVVLGDPGDRGPAQYHLAQQLIREFRQEPFGCLVVLGDNVYEYGEPAHFDAALGPYGQKTHTALHPKMWSASHRGTGSALQLAKPRGASVSRLTNSVASQVFDALWEWGTAQSVSLGVSHLLHTKRPSHLRAFLDKRGNVEGEVLDRLIDLNVVLPGGGRPDAIVVFLKPSQQPHP